MFVHEELLPAFLDEFRRRTELIRLGDPMDLHTDMGPVIHREHRDKVVRYIEMGLREGATLVTGGAEPPVLTGPGAGDLDPAGFVRPTIFSACQDDMCIVREEIFGPVATVLAFRDEAEVVARANDTPTGLAAGVLTNDLARAHRVVEQLQAGVCWINNFNLAPVELPWGGYKQSGLGRENGAAALEHWTQTKAVFVDTSGRIDCPYPKQ